ncbi:MAG: hypothetical protein U0800_13005 [Isosphaeraceae bacterium]
MKDLNIADVTISAMLGVGSKEYYAARNASGTVDLFVTDGTALGTSKLASFPIPATPSPKPPLDNLTSVDQGSQLYFTVDQGFDGLGLWKIDTATKGLSKVKDVPGAAGRASTWFPTSLTAVGERLYFIANDGITGNEVWTSDGTIDGTVALDFAPQSQGLFPNEGTLVGVGSTLYVSTNSNLYKYDGTTAAPVLVKDAQGNAAPGTLPGYNPAAIGTKLFYTSYGQFYEFDTATSVLSTLGVPAAGQANGLTVVGSQVFFFTITTAGANPAGTQLWTSDGTVNGTKSLQTIAASVDNFSATGVAAGGTFVYSLNDGNGTPGRATAR